MARRAGARAKLVTGQGSIGLWKVNPTNPGLGGVGKASIQKPRAGRKRRKARTGGNTQIRVERKRPPIDGGGKPDAAPYARRKELLVDLLWLQSKRLLTPSTRTKRLESLAEVDRTVARACLDRIERLSRLLVSRTAGKRVDWPVHFGGNSYRIRVVVDAVLGYSRPLRGMDDSEIRASP